MELSFQNVDAFCARIELEQERPVIALSQLEWIEPFAVIYMGQFLRYHNRSGKAFDVDPPRDEKVRKYLARIRFWDRFNFKHIQCSAPNNLVLQSVYKSVFINNWSARCVYYNSTFFHQFHAVII